MKEGGFYIFNLLVYNKYFKSQNKFYYFTYKINCLNPDQIHNIFNNRWSTKMMLTPMGPSPINSMLNF
jgi:hypothetical protein